MLNLKKNRIYVLMLILIGSCTSEKDKPFLRCSDCSNLNGITLKERENSLYIFSLDYPIGYLDGLAKRIPYFKFSFLLKDMGDKIMVYDSVRSEFFDFLNFENRSSKNEFFFDKDKVVEIAIDTSFTKKSNLVYEVRMKNLYNFNSYLPLFGQDFVFFISTEGILGMYISNTEKGYGIYEEINASIGDVFYKKKNDLYEGLE